MIWNILHFRMNPFIFYLYHVCVRKNGDIKKTTCCLFTLSKLEVFACNHGDNLNQSKLTVSILVQFKETHMIRVQVNITISSFISSRKIRHQFSFQAMDDKTGWKHTWFLQFWVLNSVKKIRFSFYLHLFVPVVKRKLQTPKGTLTQSISHKIFLYCWLYMNSRTKSLSPGSWKCCFFVSSDKVTITNACTQVWKLLRCSSFFRKYQVCPGQ